MSEANYEGLTLANFSERTGQERFRITKDQKQRGISRELALVEWIAAHKAATVQEKMQAKLADKVAPVVASKPAEPDEATGLLPGDLFCVAGEATQYRFAYRHIQGIIRAETTVKNAQGFLEYIWLDRRSKIEKIKNV